jgi:hypothetical protein
MGVIARIRIHVYHSKYNTNKPPPTVSVIGVIKRAHGVFENAIRKHEYN